MRIRKLIGLLFTVFLACVAVLLDEIHVLALQYENFQYEIINDEAKITEYTLSKSFTYIPDEIDGYPVVTIGYRAFQGRYNNDNTEIPEGIRVIEEEAFLGVLGYGYVDVTIPKSVEEVGKCAFGYTLVSDNGNTFYYKKIYNMIIRGYTNTAAETYANENGFTFIALDDQTTTTEVSTATTESQTFTTTTSSTLCGDINLDGTIDISDAVLLQKYAAEMVELNQQQQLNGDCNADGSTDAQDALSLLRFLVRLTEVLPDVIAN